MLNRVLLPALISFAVALLGVRHETRSPNQHINQYWAVRTLSIWTLFGAEVYSHNQLGVYDMSGRTSADLPKPIGTIDSQTRWMGKITQGTDQFNLGEDHYRDKACVDYIYSVLGSSTDPSHRLVATSIFLGPTANYPLTSQLRDALTSDPDETVRARMRMILDHEH